MLFPTALFSMETLSQSICRSCLSRLRESCGIATRSFSSTAPSRAIPPESPHFIDVPQSLQPDFIRPQKQKGYLPKPKEIFPRNLPNKPTERYISAATPSPRIPVDLNDPTLSEHARYKARMSALRKSHLRTGLTELYTRKQSITNRVQLRSNMKQAESLRLVSQAPREDERLTNVSIPSTMSPEHISRFSPEEALRLHEQKSANVARTAAAKTADRVDSMHTLYMNARNFITTEEQLRSAIQKEFDENNFDGLRGEVHKSYWDTKGPPDGIKEMLARQYVSPRLSPRDGGEEGRYKRDQERMKKIAEKLSGGKM